MMKLGQPRPVRNRFRAARRAIAWLVAGALTLAPLGLASEPAGAQSGLSIDRRVTILLRAAAYERGIRSQEGPFTVGILAPEDDAETQQATRAFARLSRVQIAGRDVRVVRLRSASAARLRAAASSASVELLYVPHQFGELAEEAARSGAIRPGMIVACADPTDVGHGCFLSVDASGEGAGLVVHLGLARAADVRFDSRMLRLARVIR